MLTSEQQLANRFAIAHRDMDDAWQYLEALLELSQEQEKSSDSKYFYHCEAILIAAVISYCRCFKRSNSAENATNKLNDSNFSFFSSRPDLLELHKRILNLRDKSIAHADWEFHNSEQINTDSNIGVLRRSSIPDYGHQLNIEIFKELINEVTQTCIANVYDIDISYKSTSKSDSIKSLLLSATNIIQSDEAVIEAQMLLQHLLNVNRAWIISHENDALEASIHKAFEALLQRRVNGEPIAYILGTREFYGLNLKVTPDTLIPRPDTETLVEAALAKIPQDKKTHVLDLGTGTGAIALAIAKHRPQAFVYAVDASQAALDVAIDNAKNLEISNVKFVLSDWFSNLINERFDVIVSNPPYIEADDAHLTQGDLRYEPIKALASGVDGLNAIRTIITNAPQHLTPHGWLLLEHGYNQAESVASLLKQASFTEISHAQDLAGIQRVTLGRLA